MKSVKKENIFAKVVFIFIVLCLWEIISKAKVFGDNSELVFPPLEAIFAAFFKNFINGYAGVSLWIYIANSLRLLLEGLTIGVFLAFLFSCLSMLSDIFNNIYNLVVLIFDLLPGITLLPVMIIIVGVKSEVIVFLVVHSVLWPMSRSILDGFNAVSDIYIDVGLNIGLRGIGLMFGVYIPASASYIISGLKSGWARAWRGLISAEMIFGIASCPGIGLFINQMRVNMNNAEMYATLMVIIIIGLAVQYGIFLPIEHYTIKKWGITKY